MLVSSLVYLTMLSQSHRSYSVIRTSLRATNRKEREIDPVLSYNLLVEVPQLTTANHVSRRLFRWCWPERGSWAPCVCCCWYNRSANVFWRSVALPSAAWPAYCLVSTPSWCSGIPSQPRSGCLWPSSYCFLSPTASSARCRGCYSARSSPFGPAASPVESQPPPATCSCSSPLRRTWMSRTASCFTAHSGSMAV